MTYYAIGRDDREIVCHTRRDFANTIAEFIMSDPGGNKPDNDGEVWLELWVSDDV